jgi:phosphate:Na+ symporter
LIKDSALLTETIRETIRDIGEKRWHDAEQRCEETAATIHDHEEPLRNQIFGQVAIDKIDVPPATGMLEAIRWLKRVSKHIYRITRHYHQSMIAAGK